MIENDIPKEEIKEPELSRAEVILKDASKYPSLWKKTMYVHTAYYDMILSQLEIASELLKKLVRHPEVKVTEPIKLEEPTKPKRGRPNKK